MMNIKQINGFAVSSVGYRRAQQALNWGKEMPREHNERDAGQREFKGER